TRYVFACGSNFEDQVNASGYLLIADSYVDPTLKVGIALFYLPGGGEPPTPIGGLSIADASSSGIGDLTDGKLKLGIRFTDGVAVGYISKGGSELVTTEQPGA